MEKITDACKAGAEKVKEMVSGTSKEANKEIAKDSNESIGTRAGAAIDAAGDKIDETKHAAQKEVHKQQAMH
ncbi:unnamed protein product [Rotaria sordida]|uniref:Uncharacterized protein n=1 Tax=Rotaria sordida TaxID=392033 RepID=A0A813ZIG6_9BILA|nr:unnamed protein product [Rotaria sordida]CAF0899977.1 unnamed protein product [Rotaria sordida]CAF3628385.1 unnamed protein product [Rotaria sordida]CAF3667341.1 unnamed protein product [Rotaria sordida]